MGILDRLAARDRERGALGRHSVMLASLVFLLFALPLAERAPGGVGRFPILLCLVVLAAIYVNRTQRWILWAAILLGIGTMVGLATAHTSGSNGGRILADVLGLCLLGLTTLVLMNALVQAREVDRDTIVGGICIYLMIGLCFALVYRLLMDVSPDAFAVGGVSLDGSAIDPSSLAARLLYFSFVTLTTVGYGDIIPQGEIVQMAAASEAIIGQLYLTIFIARMMGLYMQRDAQRDRGRDS